MSLLWFMVGLTLIVLLVLNIILLRRNRSEKRQYMLKSALDKESAFQTNCLKYNLSEREVEVLRLMLTGHTYKSAADVLFISEKTVDAHLRSIYAKSGVKNKVELVVKFYS